MVTNNNRGQTILLQVHRGKRSRYFWTNYNLQAQPTSLLSERGENVNFETQDCEHFPGEAGISQHFIRRCIQLMTLRMRIFDKPLRRILTTVNSTISSNLWNSRQDWIGTSTTFLGNILGFFARNFHKSHTRNST